ncbi:hypothetical protein B0H10DRAFT_1944262 [Mycena sp. CBHHK59/15]|nr:hypothetical protein B0H10DRAFT_1944262 [Mycena sp. CBHHK59/15]
MPLYIFWVVHVVSLILVLFSVLHDVCTLCQNLGLGSINVYGSTATCCMGAGCTRFVHPSHVPPSECSAVSSEGNAGLPHPAGVLGWAGMVPTPQVQHSLVQDDWTPGVSADVGGVRNETRRGVGMTLRDAFSVLPHWVLGALFAVEAPASVVLVAGGTLATDIVSGGGGEGRGALQIRVPLVGGRLVLEPVTNIDEALCVGGGVAMVEYIEALHKVGGSTMNAGVSAGPWVCTASLIVRGGSGGTRGAVDVVGGGVIKSNGARRNGGSGDGVGGCR